MNANYTLQNKEDYELMEQPNNVLLDGALSQSWDHTYDIAEVEGVTRQEVFDDDMYSALVNANPGNTPYFAVVCGDHNKTTGQSINVMVSFVFHTRWSEPNPQSMS